MTRNLSAIVLISLSLVGCVDRAEEIPGYLAQDNYRFTYTTPQSEGGVDITDTWLFVDDIHMGVLELPYEVAIQGETHKLEFRAGIKVNGMSAVRMAYPFYRPFKPNATFGFFPDSTISVEPVYQYVDDLTFPWHEDFEDAFYSLEPAVGSDTVNYRVETTSNDPDYLDGFMTYAAIDAGTPFLRLASRESFALPTNGIPVFLEIDIKSTNPLTILLAYDPNNGPPDEFPMLTLNATGENIEDAEWKKIYVELTPYLAEFNNSPTYGIILQGEHNGSSKLAEYYIDNLKIVYQ